jgi:hypothetical protein
VVSRLEVFDTDDDDTIDDDGTGGDKAEQSREKDGSVADSIPSDDDALAARMSASPVPSPMPEPVADSVEYVEGGTTVSETVVTPVVPSSQGSSSCQSGSEKHNGTATSDKEDRVAELGKNARTALHRLESATGVFVAARHRSDLVDHVLALGDLPALENLRLTLGCWQSGSESIMSRALPAGPGSGSGPCYSRGPALDRFSLVYRSAVDTALCRAAIDILYRIRLAFLYEVYLETLQTLSHLALQTTATPSNGGSRAVDIFNEDVREVATDRMFFACYPQLDSTIARTNFGTMNRKFRAVLASAERWHTLRENLSLGSLALFPSRANRWVERLPVAYLSVYTTLVKEVNPIAVSMGEMISERIRGFWQNESPPDSRLLLESLVTDKDISMYKDDPLRLLEEVYPDGRRSPKQGETGRAATVPADLDVNDTAAVAEFTEAAFSSVPKQVRGYEEGDWLF